MTAVQPDGAIRTLSSGSVADAIFSPDGSKMYVAKDGSVYQYDVASGAQLNSWTLGKKLGAIDLSADGRSLVAGEQSASSGTSSSLLVYKLDVASGTKQVFSSGPGSYSSAVGDIAYLGNEKVLISTSASGYIIDISTGMFSSFSSYFNGFYYSARSSVFSSIVDHSKVLIGSGLNIGLYSSDSDAIVASSTDHNSVRAAQAISSSGNLIIEDTSQGLTVYNNALLTQANLQTRYPFWTDSIEGLSFSSDGDKAYLLDVKSNTVFTLSTTTWDVLGSISLQLLPLSSATATYGDAVVASSDGHYLSVITSGGVQLIDLMKVVSDAGTEGNDSLIGDNNTNYIYGFGGDDIIDGGRGYDFMYGGLGNDTYYVDDRSDTIIEQANQGYDTVYSSVSYTLPSNVEKLVLTGTGTIQGTGSTGSDVIIGNDSRNTLIGEAGDDYLDGRAGADLMLGGTGDDTYVVDNQGDVVSENPGEGNDLVLSSISYTLPANVERLTLTGSANINGTGNDLDNMIVGNTGNNILLGGAGNDVIAPGAGRDIVDGGDGTDTLVLAGTRASYRVVTADGYAFLMGADGGGVRVANVEKVQFADGTVDWSTVAAGASALDGLTYIAGYADLRKAIGTDAAAGVDQFVASGFLEGRSTAPFDPAEYLASNPDLIRAYGNDTKAAVAHYIQLGAAEGRSLDSFDAREYLASNPDLARAFGDDPAAGVRHYLDFGFKEGRYTTSFDALEYTASNPDLILTFGENKAAAVQHYLDFGFKEGRVTTGFDAREYIASNPDLVRAFGENQAAAVQHYVDFGYKEGRATTSFDALAYAAASPDLAAAIGTDRIAAEIHYIDYGLKEGRPTGGFDAVAYELTYQDLGKAGLTPQQALIHWLTDGADEGRIGDALYGREQANHAAAANGVTHDALETATDHDWFSTTLTAGQTIDLTLATATFDPLLQIFDDHGVLLAQAAGATTGATAATAFTAGHAGVYYFGASATDSHVGAYDLTIHPHG